MDVLGRSSEKKEEEEENNTNLGRVYTLSKLKSGSTIFRAPNTHSYWLLVNCLTNNKITQVR